jgi:hypothetical protein
MHLKKNLNVEDLWSELKDCFRTFCIKCLAIKEDNEWRNIMLTGFLTKESKESVEYKIEQEYEQLRNLGVMELKNLLITYEIGWDFLNMINQCASGSITLRGQVIKLRDLEEKDKIRLEDYSYVISEEPYDYPIIGCLIHSRSACGGIEAIRELEEELKEFGYSSIKQLGLQWLKMTNIRSLSINGAINIPFYFKPLSLTITDRRIEFNGISHKNLIPKISLKVTLEKALHNEYVPVENYLVKLQPKSANNNIIEVHAIQPFNSALNKDDFVNLVIASRLGIISEERKNVESLLQSKVLTEDFPKLVTQFINLEELEALLKGEKLVGDTIKSLLSFQRAAVWLLSLLGFRVVEIEGTKFKEIIERDRTRRECDLLIYDPKGKMYIVDVTQRVPKNEKIDDIANLQDALQRRGVFVEPLIITQDPAGETKKNIRGVKMLDRADIESIIYHLRSGNIENAKKIVSG